MAMTKNQMRQIAMDAIKDNIRWEGEGPDTRTLAELEDAFLERHLYGGLVNSYRASQARKGIEAFSRADIQELPAVL